VKSKQHKRRFCILDVAAEETIDAEIRVMRSLIFQQRPPKPPPQTPQIEARCHQNPQTLDYVIIPQTAVIVENDQGSLKEHTTKELHIHRGTTFSSSNSAQMNKAYHQFATGHARWPYMFVLRAEFETEKKSDPFGEECVKTKIVGHTATATFLDEFGNVPAKPSYDDIVDDALIGSLKGLAKATRSPLTKRQIKLLRKKNVCPDCKQQGMCWSVGPTILGQQKYKCTKCHVMFKMTPMGTERI